MITLEHVSKVFESNGQLVRAVDDVSFEVEAGALHVLIGPSGSGKTTTMRMINRLEAISEGTITVGGRDVRTMNVVELRRSIGYVIQQGGLFPHFTVAENVAVVPRLLGWPRARRRRRAEELLALVGLPPEQFADRYPRQLSGGQQQRVGVARALAADPPIILMDEPFGAVDPITRKQLQRELRRIQSEVHKTIVFVTHDISEAFLLGDRIVLMAEGRIVQNGTSADLLRTPASPFVTEFIGEDRSLRALRHTYLAELASPRPVDLPDGVPVLSGSLSIPEAGHALSRLDGSKHDGFLVSDEAGQPRGYLTYHRLATVLGESIAPADEMMPGGTTPDGKVAHVVPD
ncbi:MAG TPA: ATP-binding cassette domain-containing protein [Thermomicrobiales bacterium]|nr:ATP-binding cassette domain-containing protein [Thermomicrobiales bacterium]